MATRVTLALLLGVLSISAYAENTLVGKWRLVNGNGDNAIGTLSANGKFFTIALEEPSVSFTAGYTQAPTGEFRCTVIDKNVVVMEGRFRNPSTINMDITVKEIGKPEKKSWQLIAIRDE
jgi:hypothetical protein